MADNMDEEEGSESLTASDFEFLNRDNFFDNLSEAFNMTSKCKK
jgi:hypothetical protein